MERASSTAASQPLSAQSSVGTTVLHGASSAVLSSADPSGGGAAPEVQGNAGAVQSAGSALPAGNSGLGAVADALQQQRSGSAEEGAAASGGAGNEPLALVAAAAAAAAKPVVEELLLILKWGGVLTHAGRRQAEDLGRTFRLVQYPRCVVVVVVKAWLKLGSNGLSSCEWSCRATPSTHQPPHTTTRPSTQPQPHPPALQPTGTGQSGVASCASTPPTATT